jgi:hypothetical protein
MEDEKPSTKHLVLKPREVTPTDRVSRPGDGTEISVQLIHRQNQLAEERAARGTRGPFPDPEPAGGSAPPLSPVFKPKEIVAVNQPARAGDEEAIAVPDILLENRIAEEESGWGRVKHRKKKFSRRTRDFLVGVGTVDAAIILFMHWSLNPVSFIFGLSAVTLLTSWAAWIMFVVMDDY